MAKKPKIGLYEDSTARRVLKSISASTTNNIKNRTTVGAIETAPEIEETRVVKIVSDDDNGYYTVQEQIWDNTAVDEADHEWIDLTDTSTFTAKETSGATGIAVDEVFRIWTDVSKDGIIWLFQQGGGAGQTWATTPNTNLSYTNGATYDVPAGTATELTEATAFLIVTPWNHSVVAPSNLFAFWTELNGSYYRQIDEFYVSPTENYPNSGGITTFNCYLNDSTSFLLGGHLTFPSGVEAVFEGFNNTTAHNDMLSYFNGRRFKASYSPSDNKVYFNHPRF